jgi:DNA-binding MarR family transcriptional regulator
VDRKKRMTVLVERLTILLGESQVPVINRIVEMGLTAKQVNYLTAVSRLDNPRLSDLGAELGLSNPSVTAIVKKFVELGYVAKTQSGDDGRSFRVRLTEKGRELENIHRQSHEEMADTLMRNLDGGEIDQLIGLFEKIVED